MKQAIVIATSLDRGEYLDNCMKSLSGYTKYPIFVVTNGSYECGKIKQIMDYTDIDEFFFLCDSVEIKNPCFIETAFKMEGINVCINAQPYYYGMFLGKYRREVLEKMVIPETNNKAESVEQEQSFNRLYIQTDPKIGVLFPEFVNQNKFEVKFGRTNMILENDYLKKYKATWSRDMVV